MLLTMLSLIISSSVFAVNWGPNNNPYKMGSDFKSKLSILPDSGQLKDQQLGWPGNHWASNIGGIAHRWSSSNPQNFSYKRLSLAELKQLESYQIDELSPAEKFDIFNAHYDYPTVKNVFSRISPNDNPWNGICHGYAPAALNHQEPASVTLINPDGISVHFYSSDVAALMSFYYANIATTTVTLIGSRCNYNATTGIPRRSQAACEDMNAGAFHLILSNKLGLKGVTFVADIDRYLEVWNHLPVSYKSTYSGELAPSITSAAETVKRVYVETIVTYAAAIAPKFDPVLNTENAEYVPYIYGYFLDLDKNGDIVGGDWVGEARPDFVWTQKKAAFLKEWTSLNQVYRPAVSVPD